MRLRYRRRSVSAGHPEILILRHRLTTVRVTSDRAPSGSPQLILRVAPVPLPWLRRRDQFPGCPKSRVSSPFADSLRFESPRTSVPQLTRICFTGCPASASAAGSMMSPWLNRTLHPRFAPRMNLRFQSGHNNPLPASSTFHNLNLSIHYRQADHESLNRNCPTHLLPVEAAVPINYRVTS